MDIVTILFIGLLGLVLGSFVNAFVWRLHETEELQEQLENAGKKDTKRSQAIKEEIKTLSITKGRSMCPSCHHELAPKDLVPVFSWLYLRGKCRYCKAHIPDSPLVEVATAALFVLSYLSWPMAFEGVGLFQFIVWLFFVVAFVSLAVYDLRWFLLPDRIVVPLVGVALMQVVVVAVATHSLTALWQPLAGAAIIFGLFYGLFQLSNGAWIGGGDVKLAVVLGLVAGSPVRALMVIFFASLLGTFVSIPLLMKGKKSLKVRIPFGPYLLAATIIVVLYGSAIIDWYNGLFLLG